MRIDDRGIDDRCRYRDGQIDNSLMIDRQRRYKTERQIGCSLV